MAFTPTADKTTGTRCAQCGAENPEGGFRTAKIFTRGWDHARGKQRLEHHLHTVCAVGPCGGHLQMAHEG